MKYIFISLLGLTIPCFVSADCSYSKTVSSAGYIYVQPIYECELLPSIFTAPTGGFPVAFYLSGKVRYVEISRDYQVSPNVKLLAKFGSIQYFEDGSINQLKGFSDEQKLKSGFVVMKQLGWINYFPANRINCFGPLAKDYGKAKVCDVVCFDKNDKPQVIGTGC